GGGRGGGGGGGVGGEGGGGGPEGAPGPGGRGGGRIEPPFAVVQGTSPGMVRKRLAPRARAACCARATASVWPRLSSSLRIVASWRRANACAEGSRVTTSTSPRRARPSASSTSCSMARGTSLRSGGERKDTSRCLAFTRSFTGTATTVLMRARRARDGRGRSRPGGHA